MLLIKKKSSFKLAPLFDNGSAFLSNTDRYPIDKEIACFLPAIECKPFSSLFEEQNYVLESKYGIQLSFQPDKERLIPVFKTIEEFYPERYSQRIEEIYDYQVQQNYPFIHMLDNEHYLGDIEIDEKQ